VSRSFEHLLAAFLAYALLLINWELSHNAGSVCHKLIKVSYSLSRNYVGCMSIVYNILLYRPSGVEAYRL